MAFAATIITLFPEAFPGTLGLSLIGKALGEGLWSLDTVQLRDFGQGAHKQVDDTPSGGGAGMVIRADVAAAAIDSIPRNDRALIYLSPRGKPLNQAMVRDWANGPGVILFCGRFEGLDERVIEARGMQEVAVGDAVLAGGEAAALVLLEACVRLLPGVALTVAPLPGAELPGAQPDPGNPGAGPWIQIAHAPSVRLSGRLLPPKPGNLVVVGRGIADQPLGQGEDPLRHAQG